MTSSKESQTQRHRTDHRKGFSATSNRRSKADKILTVLNEFQKINHVPPKSFLDIGTGSGEIASNLAEIARVTSIDVEDTRTCKTGYRFIRINDETLPFPDRSFDVVISNHVIEHVVDAQKHLAEIARVLRDDGLVYLATPNRIWPWEFHYQLFFLHYLPHSLFIFLLKMAGRYKEDVKLLSLFGLRKILHRHFRLYLYSDRICKWPGRYHLNYPAFLLKIVNVLPLSAYTRLALFHPTLIFLLKKKAPSRAT